MGFQEAANEVLLNAEKRIGDLIMEGEVENLTEQQSREAARNFLNDVYNGQRDVSDGALNSVLSQAGAGEHTPETEEMFAKLRDMLLKGQYQAPEVSVKAGADIAQDTQLSTPVSVPDEQGAAVTTQTIGHNEITESILNNVAETMGGEVSGWDVDRVKQIVQDITFGRMEQGDFRESFEAAVINAYEQAPAGDGMIRMLEHRSALVLGGDPNEERMEHMAVGQLNGMINVYEQNLVNEAQQMQVDAPAAGELKNESTGLNL